LRLSADVGLDEGHVVFVGQRARLGEMMPAVTVFSRPKATDRRDHSPTFRLRSFADSPTGSLGVDLTSATSVDGRRRSLLR